MDLLLSREPPRILNRRVSDKIMLAFEQACAQNELEVAHELLCLLEAMLEHPQTHGREDRRANIESLVGAHHRLWVLRQRGRGEGVGSPALRVC